MYRCRLVLAASPRPPTWFSFRTMNTPAQAQIGPSVYDKWRGSALGRTTDVRERELLLDLIGDVAGQAVLDVGCGDGELAFELWKRGAKITGIDASARMIEVARERARQHRADVTFDLATTRALPFPPKAFDLVVAVTVLCFIEDATKSRMRCIRTKPTDAKNRLDNSVDDHRAVSMPQENEECELSHNLDPKLPFAARMMQ